MNFKRLLEKANEKYGFEAWEVGTTNRELTKLMNLGIVEIRLKTNKRTIWKISNLEKLKKIIELRETKITLPPTPLFSSIIGYEKHKEILKRVIESNKPIHCLLLGSVATAKTLFLLELTKLDSSYYISPYITYAGLFDTLIVNPKFLLIDQLDNLKENSVYRLLIDLMEYGYLTKVTHSEILKDRLKTKVIATANTIKRIPQALRSRFLILRFRCYSEEEYRRVALKLLDGFNLCKDLKEYIIEKTIDYRDVRNVLKLAKICRSMQDVDYFKDIIKFC